MSRTMKKTLLIITAVVLLLLAVVGRHSIWRWLYNEQYNSKGVSHFLVITIDKDQPPEFIGNLENHDIYLEQLDKNSTFFRSDDAENITLDKAFSENMVSIDDWRKYARKIKSNGNEEILKFENYEIAVTDNECTIRPLSR